MNRYILEGVFTWNSLHCTLSVSIVVCGHLISHSMGGSLSNESVSTRQLTFSELNRKRWFVCCQVKAVVWQILWKVQEVFSIAHLEPGTICTIGMQSGPLLGSFPVSNKLGFLFNLENVNCIFRTVVALSWVPKHYLCKTKAMIPNKNIILLCC